MNHRSSGSVLTRPVFVASLLLLIVNDALLKPALGRGTMVIVTGKLSDGAALIVVAALLSLVARPLISVAAPAVVLVAINLIPAASDGYEIVAASLTGLRQSLTPDPTDLAALIVLPLAWRLVARPAVERRRPTTAVLLGLTALVVATASGRDADDPPQAIDVIDGALLVVPTDPGFSRQVSVDDGLTWERVGDESALADVEPGSTVTSLCLTGATEQCFRIGDDLSSIDESTDGGTTWNRVWKEWNGEWTFPALGGNIQMIDMVETPNGTVLVTAASVDPIRRSVDGTWSPTPGDLRPFDHYAWFTLVAPIVVIGLAAAARAVSDRFSVISLATLLAFGGIGLLVLRLVALDVEGFLIFPSLAALALTAVVVAVTLFNHRGPNPGWQQIPKVAAIIAVGSALAMGCIALWAAGFGPWQTAQNVATVIGLITGGLAVFIAESGREEPAPPTGPAAPTDSSAAR